MNSIIVNKNTLALAEKEMWLAYRSVYLTLQHCLLTFLKEAQNPEKKRILKKKIKKVGDIYKEVMKKVKK